MVSCGKWTHMPMNEKETILVQYRVHGNTRKLVMPSEIDGYTVREIYWQAIKGGSRLKKIVLPATLKRLNGCPHDENSCDVELELDFQNCDLKIQDGGTVTDSTGSVLMWLREESRMICHGKPEDYENSLRMSFVGEYSMSCYLEGNQLTEIGDYALAGCDSICKIVVPKGVRRIGTGAFMSCRALECVELPDTIEEIDSFAFKACRNLKSFTMPEQVREISSGLFEDCVNLTELNKTMEICSVGQSAFKGCMCLQKIELTDECKRINRGAFEGCMFVDQHELWFDSEDCRVERGAFSGCSEELRALENVGEWRHERISKTETMITGHYPDNFEKTLVIPEEIDGYTVRAIGWRAIGEGRMLEKIVLPATLKRLNGWPCQMTSDSVRLELDSGNSYLKMQSDDSVTDSAGEELMCFPNGAGYRRYEAPQTLKVISDHAFHHCTFLREAVLHEGIKRIGQRAFSHCVDLEPINLQGSIGVIAEDAFSCCSQKVQDSVKAYIRENEKRIQARIDEIIANTDWNLIDL